MAQNHGTPLKSDSAADPTGKPPPSAAQGAEIVTYLRSRTEHLFGTIGVVPPLPFDPDDSRFLASDPLGSLDASIKKAMDEFHKTNERLRLVHEDMRAVFDLAGVAILVVDNDFNVMAHNKLAQENFGIENSSMIYRSCFEMICRNTEPPEYCMLREAIDSGQRMEKSGLKIGEKIFDVVATPVLGGDGNTHHTVMTYMDITSRQKAMDALAVSEKKYRELFESANDLIQVSHPEGRILYVNAAWRKATGCDPGDDTDVSKLLPPECRADYANAVRTAISRESGARIETEFLTIDGRRILLDGNITSSKNEGGETLVRAIFRDITRQRRLEEEIATAQRMDTVGQLAGGIAHDFNNALTAILGNISLAKMYEASGYLVRDKLEKAEQAVIRARGLTRQLLTFSTGGAPVKKEMCLIPFVADSVNFTLSGSNIRADFEMAKDLKNVEVDSGQLEQVIQNLVLNGIQSMSGGGVISIECSNVAVDDASSLPLPHGEYVRLSVIDSGVGIPPGNLERVFDPFFTTKDGGKGMGLASSFSIIRRHGGTINVQSSVGKGSRFDVYLPAKERREPPKTPHTGGDLAGGRILVMDDEADIRDLLESLLGHLGYEVKSAADGTVALELYKKALERGAPFDLVVMDLTVPGGMGGKELMKRLVRLDPKVVGIVSSGYSGDPVMSDYGNYGFAGVAAKPYRVESLIGQIAVLISRKKSSKMRGKS